MEKVLISGASGLIGTALRAALEPQYRVVPLGRAAAAGAEALRWDPAAGRLEAAELEGFDAVVHLAGENIAAGRWSAARKARIRDSRLEGTRLLCAALEQVQRAPQVLLCASAVGYYGDRGEEVLREHSAPGAGFLAELCRQWEAAAEPARRRGIRVVHARLGMVLSPAGGALARLLPPFELGLGGRLGKGRQYMSWIAIDDVVGAMRYALRAEALEGPLNLTAPQTLTNAEFTRVLGRVLGRPALLPLPAPLLRLLLGEMAGALLLAGARVEPARLLEAGYSFRYPELEGALRHLLGRS